APTKAILKLVKRSNPRVETQLNQLLTVLGLSLQGDIYPLLSGEQALALYPGKPIPGIAFVAKVPNPGRASDLVARVLQLAKLSGATTVTSFDVHGTTVDELSQKGGGVHVYVTVASDKLIVTTTGRDTLSTLVAGEGTTLADDALYKRALTDAK